MRRSGRKNQTKTICLPSFEGVWHLDIQDAFIRIVVLWISPTQLRDKCSSEWYMNKISLINLQVMAIFLLNMLYFYS